MNRYLFLKVDEEKKVSGSRRKLAQPSMDPKLLALLTARYV